VTKTSFAALSLAALLGAALLPTPATGAAADAPTEVGWVTGVVVDASGAPVEGAMVNVLTPSRIPERGVLDETADTTDVTDAEGRFRVRQEARFLLQVCDLDEDMPWACTEPMSSEYLLQYVGPDGGFDSWLQHTDLYRGSATDLGLGEVVVRPGAQISGTIADAPHTRVEVMRGNDTMAYATQTAADGSYSFPGLAPGSYYVRAGGFGSLPWQSHMVTIDAEDPARVDGALDGGASLTGRLMDGERPAARVEVLLKKAGEPVASTLTNRRGVVRFTGLTPGVHRLELLPGSTYLPTGTRVEITDADGEAATTLHVRRGASVTVTFVGQGRHSVNDELRDGDGDVVASNVGIDGRVTYRGLRPGTYTVLAADELGYGRRTFEIANRRAHDLGRLRLGRTLLTLRGRTAPGAVVEATTGDLCPPDGSPTYGGFHQIGQRADGDGRYVIHGLVPGRYMVAADGFPSNYAPICHEDVRVSSSRRYDVPLAQGHVVSGRLVYEGTTRPLITTLSYELHHPAGLATNPTGEHPAVDRTAGASGRFAIDRLPSGPATGTLAVQTGSQITHPKFLVLFPFQDATPYWLETAPRSLDVQGDVDLGDVALLLRTGSVTTAE
jgi:hypothetical protein